MNWHVGGTKVSGAAGVGDGWRRRNGGGRTKGRDGNNI
jgi:hypothetical protein